MTRRLVAVDVDAHHEVDRREGTVEPAGLGIRQHGIAADRDERADLTVPRRLDLLGERDDGQFAVELRDATDATAATPERHPATPAGRATSVRAAGGRQREHRTARTVEIAGAHVDDV